jgi:branched-chain amino acid aminotransferase
MNSPKKGSHQIVWLNGRFLPIHKAGISPLDRGFMYGDGLFETMRSEDGCILYLNDHLERLHRSLEALKISLDPSLEWKIVLGELLQQNELLSEVAVVKIIATRGVCSGLGLPAPVLPTICLTAQRYNPPHPESYVKGWHLSAFRTGFSPPTACHKTLNYLYFLTARQAALDAGADEAVILDPLEKVTETSTGSLVARTEGKWWTPEGRIQLPGITLKHVSRLLIESGHQVESRTAGLDDLLSAETVWVLNSLMGIMPVSRIEEIQLMNPAAQEAAYFRKRLLETGKQAP